MWFSLYRKVILYIYNFIIFVLCKIKHLYNFKDSSYFQLIQKNKAKKRKKNENRKRTQINRTGWTVSLPSEEVLDIWLIPSPTPSHFKPKYNQSLRVMLMNNQSFLRNSHDIKTASNQKNDRIDPFGKGLLDHNNENLYTTLYHIYPAVILKLYLQYF